ncbi:hypothetical protein B0T26DRAFT_644226 [Lasiosphaeria miniovina]|uniref:Uncharacterized protein n=1 Tax=Lasiosphaeria miniovina TaxID=1954250 RepID=A0AA40AVU4_9PEZI|nr:uncharacterized protein B0T26DRAFT_644226 [Lasiosphaeria miniovina]KAK0722904.1 hypothetical protein B0T26DRAFT_644226 [Lasiosphaeria miniovina]
MASQTPSTPVKVPASAANYTPATLDPDLRSQINSLLLKEGHVTKIQDQLLHSLHAHHSNWPTTVQAHAVALLRSGEVTTFPVLLRRVIEDIRQETTLAPHAVPPPTPAAKSANGASEVNGKKSANGTPGLEGASNGNTALPSLAVPQSAVEDALKVTRDCLEMVCEMDENGTT